jgi:DNA-binding IclR family transcriptional regulator
VARTSRSNYSTTGRAAGIDSRVRSKSDLSRICARLRIRLARRIDIDCALSIPDDCRVGVLEQAWAKTHHPHDDNGSGD